MKESKTLEFKEQINNNFLKTVSAYANFGTGKIQFGINDSGQAVGIDNPDSACLDIENKINDNIKPKPEFVFTINQKNNVITLEIKEGLYKPYLYKGKAYRRNDTSSIEVDTVELKRLVLLGSNLSFEELTYSEQNLSFNYLAKTLKSHLGIEKVTTDVLKTLGLYTNQEEFNNAGAILADKNSFFGIDIVQFGDSIDEILERNTIYKTSILEQFDKAVDIYRKNYQYEEINGIQRSKIELIPEKSFREALVNALIHRVWDVKSHIRIEMHPDKIIITSPGGLVYGVSKEDYLSGTLSILRNPIIGNIFFRLKYIEMFGTGIRRIQNSYSNYKIKPTFNITDNSISITLPELTKNVDVFGDEKIVLDALSSEIKLSSSEIVTKTKFGKDKVIRILNRLIEKDLVKVIGRGRGTKYTI